MDNQDWERFGDEIRRNVQDAIDSRDYSMLSRTISDTVNGAMDYFSHTVRGVGNSVNENIRAQQEAAARRREQEERQRNYREEVRRSMQEQGGGQNGADYSYQGNGYSYQGTDYQKTYGRTGVRRGGFREAVNPKLFSTVLPGRVGGTALAVCGYGIGGLSAISTLLIVAAGVGSEDMGLGFSAALALFGVLTVGFGTMAAAGTSMLGRTRRFRNYIRTLAGREYCDVKELQQQSGKPKKYVVNDLERMIQKGWFKEGHLDSKKSCLMVSHKAYQQYTDLMLHVKAEEQEKKQREQEQKKAQEAAGQANAKFSPEVRDALRLGDEYIKKIRACNDAIPGEEISAKISRIELLVDKIFDRVEQNPDSVSDLRRMMEYYLPTTVKLLEAYEDLDSQPVQGENIVNSKKEIEKTLDTLNVAFEKLLDSLFQDTAWDVSSDISVLHTMLAQEGLTEDGLTKKQPDQR